MLQLDIFRKNFSRLLGQFCKDCSKFVKVGENMEIEAKIEACIDRYDQTLILLLWALNFIDKCKFFNLYI